jgi:hypothetical protein
MLPQTPTTPKAMDAMHFDIENLRQLVESIRQLLAQVERNGEPSDDDAAAALDETLKRLNDELRAWTGEANRRLRLCETQFRAGNRREAVRLAEMPPALLDVCAEILSLGDDDRLFWEDIVAANHQPRPEPLLAVALEELNIEYGERGSNVQQLLDELHVMVLARAPLRARLPVLWQLAQQRANYISDVPVWELARLEQMDHEAKTAAALPEPKAVLDKLCGLVVELVVPEWTSEQDRRRRLLDALEQRIAAFEAPARQRQNDETAKRLAPGLDSLPRRYYIRLCSREVGPLDVEDLKQLRGQARFSTIHEVSGDRRAWHRATTLSEVFSSMPAASLSTTHRPLHAPVLATLVEPPSPAAPAPPPPQEEWYCAQGGERHGPFRTDVLEELLRSGQLPPNVPVWTPALGNWAPADQVPQFSPAVAGVKSATGARRSRWPVLAVGAVACAVSAAAIGVAWKFASRPSANTSTDPAEIPSGSDEKGSWP